MDWRQIKEKMKEAGYIVFILVTSIAAFVVAYYGIPSFVDSRIEKQINDADFLKKLARKVRPSLVFDKKGSIIADMGAAAYIKNISISEGTKDNLTIMVSPVEFLAVEPILEPLDGRYNIHGERGKKFDWVFHLSGISAILITDSAVPQREKQRFRLEIIR